MALERTFSIVKPDAVARNLVGEIYSRFEKAGLKIIASRMLLLSEEQAAGFYAEHDGKPFYVIHIKTSSKQFKNKNSKYLLYPGLIVDCNIVVGKRTLLENIYIPFKRFKEGTFTENVWFY